VGKLSYGAVIIRLYKMIDYKDLNTNQINTLYYFALGFSMKKIAYKLNVSVSTIRQRLRAISGKHKQAFDNACGIRNAYKISKININHPLQLSEINEPFI